MANGAMLKIMRQPQLNIGGGMAFVKELMSMHGEKITINLHAINTVAVNTQ
jgi:hypothetical protein